MKNLIITLILCICSVVFNVNAQLQTIELGSASVLPPMHIADDGIGQTLIYPYFSVRNNHDSVITLSNHTDRVKALKLNFYESRNGRRTLNFNIYLQPFDTWTATLVFTQSSVNGFVGQQSLKILTDDEAVCAAPFINDQEFLPYAFSGPFNDGLTQNMSRATEGYLVVLEMGELIGEDAEAAINASDCQRLVNNWTVPLGQWIIDNDVNVVDPSGAGGLSGTMDIVDVTRGRSYSYDAVAIKSFTNRSVHTIAGQLFPTLAFGRNFRALLTTQDGQSMVTRWTRSTVDAVTALLMQSRAINTFDADGIDKYAEWVNVYPTKSYYVDPRGSIGEIPVSPFTQGLVAPIGACEDHRFKAFDGQGHTNTVSSSPVIPDPLPANYSNRPQDCWVVNVSEVNVDSVFDSLLGSQAKTIDYGTDENYTSIRDLPFTSGMLQRDYDQEISNRGYLIGLDENDEKVIVYGKPVLGFLIENNDSNSISNLMMNLVTAKILPDVVFANDF